MERTPLFVLDASVAVEWFVDELGREKALRVREDYADGRIDLLAPELMIYEVGNALRFHPNGTKEIGSQAVKSLRKMQLTQSLQDQIIETTMQISYQEGVTFYDAAYLALAEQGKHRLITADRRLVDRLKKYHSLTLLLGDYSP